LVNHPPLEGGSKSEAIRGGVSFYESSKPLLEAALAASILPKKQRQGEDD